MEKRVLVVITTGFVSWGGLTNAFMNYYKAMNLDGLKIDIASFNDPDEELLVKLDLKTDYIKLTNKRKNPIKYLLEFARLCENYDVVHVHGNSATIAPELYIAKLEGIKTRIAHCHTRKCNHPIMNWFCSLFFFNSYTVGLAVSEEAAWPYRGKKHFILKNVIDTDKYRYSVKNRIKIRDRFGFKDSDIVIGHCGKIYDAKNHEFLVRVFNEMHKYNKNLKLFLVGDGVLKKNIENMVSQLKLDNCVIFAGMQTDTSKFYSAMDLFMFPSLYEGFSLALLEAQACGLKCLASEFVPKDVNVSGTIKHLKLELSNWITAFNEIELPDRENFSDECVKAIKKAGYDNNIAAMSLRNIYFEGCCGD